ncbi:MAG: chaperone modulator CbpM [Oligoflexia bacterium]|nr:chaperone modulator CbpM [Oligoflexia bacterium]
MGVKRLLVISEACERAGVSRQFVLHCLRARWIVPADPIEAGFDEEDLARLRLIHELQRDLGVNEEAIPIILGLLDQLHALRVALRKAA